MKQFVIIAAFAACGIAAQSAAACDWNRTTSAKDEVVGTANRAPQDTRTCRGPECAAPQPTSVAKAAGEPTPVALIAKDNSRGF